jgi:hypothetical protein
MQTGSVLVYVLAPFAVVGLACAVGALFLWRYVRTARMSPMNGGRLLQIPGPPDSVVSVRSLPESALDPRLASLPTYPGSVPYDHRVAQHVDELELLGTTFRTATARFRTPDSPSVVWAFFDAALPGWRANAERTDARREIVEAGRGGDVRSVLVYEEAGETIIEVATKPPGYGSL